MAEKLFATLKTNQGDIVLALYPDHAPKTVRNFVDLAEGTQEWKHPGTGSASQERFYDGLIFHRVIDGFMIQGGDPLGTGSGGPGYTFNDEIHPDLSFDRPYLLAMANSGSRAGKGTNGSQFFITVTEPTWLNGKHTIFGAVADDESRRVVDVIATTATGPQDRPRTPVVIESVVVDRRND